MSSATTSDSNENGETWEEGPDPQEFAKAIFKGKAVLGETLNGAGNVVVELFKNTYELSLVFGGRAWIAKDFLHQIPQRSRGKDSMTCRFFCKKCKDRKQMALVAVGLCTAGQGEENNMSLEMTHVFPHNVNCETNTPRPFKDSITVDFDFEAIIGSTYARDLGIINNQKFGQQPLVGEHINFGKEDYKEYDDRTYVSLPILQGGESEEEVKEAKQQHKWCMDRILFHFSVTLSVVSQMTFWWLDKEEIERRITEAKGNKDKWEWNHYPTKKNADAHGYLHGETLLYGGHNLSGGKNLVHRPTHFDCSKTHPMASNPDLVGNMKPGTILLTLEKTKRTIYVGSIENTVDTLQGQWTYFPGDVPHGGTSYPPKNDGTPEDWRGVLHITVRSTHEIVHDPPATYSIHTYPYETIRTKHPAASRNAMFKRAGK
jgi:hypothetical protein